MDIRYHALPAASAGTERRLRSLHFGARANGRKAYLHAALHADEVPALLVAQHLRLQLLALEEAGLIPGEIVLVPMANPVGLSQELQGSHLGRFDLSSGLNFNRAYAHLTRRLIPLLEGRLTSDEAANTALIRAAVLRLLAEEPAITETGALKQLLQALAADADVVLDLHCDNQAVMHVYAGTPQQARAEALSARLGAQALLMSRASGEHPFDETLARLWWELAEHFDGRFPIDALGCFAATVELRGETEVDDALAGRDAAALIDFLRDLGHIGGAPAPLPSALCPPTPLEAVEPLTAPVSGLLVFHKEPGDAVQAGELVLEVVCPFSDVRHPVHAGFSGRLFARVSRRWAQRGMRLAKIAGTESHRSGSLLSP